MKKYMYNLLFLTHLTALIFLTGCKKEKNNPGSDHDAAFSIDAGENMEIFIPGGIVRLQGYYNGPAGALFKWAQIGGPSSAHIEHDNSLVTIVSSLLTGVYQFELQGTSGQHTKRDTVQVMVSLPTRGEPQNGTREFILENQSWTSPWYNTILIPDFNKLVGYGQWFEVYIKRDGWSDWLYVVHMSEYTDDTQYAFSVEERAGSSAPYTYGSLYIHYFGEDINPVMVLIPIMITPWCFSGMSDWKQYWVLQ